MKKAYLNILKPDDWHVHLREGHILSSVLPFTYDNFGSALVMPNLDNPITNISLAETYYTEICRQIPEGIEFTPHMTLYFTNHLTKDEIKKVSTHEYIKAIKMYPKGATTNSNSGISNIMDVLLIASLLGLLTSGLMISLNKHSYKQTIAFGPFLILGTHFVMIKEFLL